MSLTSQRKRQNDVLPLKLEAVMLRLCQRSDEPLNKTKIVKLPYLVDVIAMQVLGRTITDGSHETWEHGVVTSEAWHSLKAPDPNLFALSQASSYSEEWKVEANPEASSNALTEDEERIVDYVVEEFGSLSATELGVMTKLMNPSVPSWGQNHSAQVNEEAYLRMTPEYQEMAASVADLSFEEIVRSSQRVEDFDDLEDVIA